jgi:hypothetical protein
MRIQSDASTRSQTIIDRDGGLVFKAWSKSYLDAEWLQRHVALVNKVLPRRIVAHGQDANRVFVVFRYVDGITLTSWLQHNAADINLCGDVFVSAIQYWIDNAKQTFPYAHMDWHGGNTIITNRDSDPFTFDMIDWDSCSLATADQIKARILHKIAREMRFNPGYIDVAQRIASSYFDKTFNGLD